MLEAAQNGLLRFLRVPPEPEPPAGAPGSVRVFQAGRNFLYYNLVRWGFGQVAAFWGLLVGVLGIQFLPDFVELGGLEWLEQWAFQYNWVELLAIGIFVVQVPVTLAGVLLDYRMRWYIVTDRSLRIREGILVVQERTMGFANIQNLSVRQGPIQRLLGISDLEVRTAGGGETPGSDPDERKKSLHLGYFRGVANAEEIKEVVLQRLRRLRDSGLGDPEEDHAEGVVPGLPGPETAPAAAGAEAADAAEAPAAWEGPAALEAPAAPAATGASSTPPAPAAPAAPAASAPADAPSRPSAPPAGAASPVPGVPSGASALLLDAARELLAEARGLRTDLGG